MIWFDRAMMVVLGLIFLVAGVTKLLDPTSFAILIGSYGLVPESFNTPISVILPLIEVIAAIGILFNRNWSLNIIAALTLLFIAILGYGIWMGLGVDCGCFGVNDPEFEAYSGLQSALIKDVMLLVGIAYLYFRRLKRTNSV